MWRRGRSLTGRKWSCSTPRNGFYWTRREASSERRGAARERLVSESPLEYVEQIEKLCRRLREALGAEPALFTVPPSANPLTEAEVDRQWADMHAMGAAFGAKWQTNLGPARRHLVKRTLRQHPGPYTLVQALRGFLRLSADWTPEFRTKCMDPGYVLRPAKIESHLEAGTEPPWGVAPLRTATLVEHPEVQAAQVEASRPISESVDEAGQVTKAGTFGG